MKRIIAITAITLGVLGFTACTPTEIQHAVDVANVAPILPPAPTEPPTTTIYPTCPGKQGWLELRHHPVPMCNDGFGNLTPAG